MFFFEIAFDCVVVVDLLKNSWKAKKNVCVSEFSVKKAMQLKKVIRFSKADL
jgi:hypothetical protein